MPILWNYLRAFVSGQRRHVLSSRASRQTRLTLEPLECRYAPAIFFYQSSFGNLGIALDRGESLTVSESGGVRTFELSQGRWFNEGPDLPSSSLGDTLTFDASRNLAGTLSIAGEATDNNVTFAGGTINSSQVLVDLSSGSHSEGDISFTTATTNLTGLISVHMHAGGTILQAAPVTIAAPASFTTDADTLNLNNPANDFRGPVSLTNLGSVGAAISDANDLNIFVINLGTGPLTIQAGGTVTFTGPWHVNINKGGASSLVSVGAAAVNLYGASLTGTATGYLLNDQIQLLNNLSAPPITGSFTNGSSVILGSTAFQIGVNVGSGNNDVVLTSQGTRNQVYVSNLYTVLFERPVDSLGLSSWSQQLDLGVSRQQVVSSLMHSPEYFNLEVTHVYQLLLHRSPDSLGMTNWVAYLQAGGNVRDMKMNLMGSAEYLQFRGGGNNEGWLTAAYNDLLGRDPDPVGMNDFLFQLNNGIPHSSVALTIYVSPEATMLLTQEFYLQYLGRPADSLGLQNNSAALSAFATEESIISGLVGSQEFYDRPLL
jgi:hypothetical protein